MRIELTKDKVLAAAREAYAANRLQAQNRSETSSCLYRDDRGFPCAVGAALTDEEAAVLNARGRNGSRIGHLLDIFAGENVLPTPNASDLNIKVEYHPSPPAGHPLDISVGENVLPTLEVITDDRAFLIDLQNAHDRWLQGQSPSGQATFERLIA